MKMWVRTGEQSVLSCPDHVAPMTRTGTVTLLHCHNLYQAIIKRRRASDVSQSTAGQLICVLAVMRQLFPPNRQHDDAARARPIGHSCQHIDAAAIVEDSNSSAVDNAARMGVARMNLDGGLAVGRAQARDVDERRVQEVTRRRRDDRERIASRQWATVRRSYGAISRRGSKRAFDLL